MGLNVLKIPHVDHPRTLADNLSGEFKDKYNYKNGNFGTPSGKLRKTNTRHIESDDPVETSKDFMKELVKGCTEREIIHDNNGNYKGEIFKMKDGSTVTWRFSSTSDGSPAVDINVSKVKDGCPINKQKIHFVKGEEK